MFNALIDALDLDRSFFIQFFLFLAFYPILSRFLLKPYYQLYIKREDLTSERIKRGDDLKKKKEQLEKKYQSKAMTLDKNFKVHYSQQSQILRQTFLNRRIQYETALKREQEKEKRKLNEEIKVASREIKQEVNSLSDIVFDRLM